jgi:hypothetical protein
VALNQSVDVFLSPELRAEAKLLMEQQGVQHHFVFDDIQRSEIGCCKTK